MKKSNYNLILHLAFWSLFACSGLNGQTNVNMAASGATPGSPFTINPPATCYFNFFDNGGPAGNYNDLADAHVTFAPSNSATHRIRINFTAFAVEPNWDALYIFNSNTVGVNQLAGPDPATISGFPAGNWSATAPGVITANTGLAAVGVNAAEALTVQFRSDGSISSPGWVALVNQVPISVCNLTAPANITQNTGAGSNTCFVNVSTPVPVIAPMGCGASYTLRYRINGGAATNTAMVGFVNIPTPVGNNVITWELIEPCGNVLIASATQMINVIDNTPPVITCPANVTLNLNSGECEAAFTYSVSCVDNCGFVMPGQVEHPIDFNNGQAGIMFNVQNVGFTPITINEFGPSIDAGAWAVQVFFTTTANSWVGNQNDPNAWDLAGTINVVSAGPAAGTPVTGFAALVLQPGESRGVYLTSTTGIPFNYTDGTRQFDDARLRVSSSPGAGIAYPFGTTFNNRSYNGYVKYNATGTSTAQLSGGIASGGLFPIGTTTNTFICTDVNGNTAMCSFNVTVNEFPNPITSLVCNDLITVALGEDCTTTIGGDQVLEGGPYRCYDSYIVELDKTAPFGNGPWVPAVLGPADVNKTYKVRVTDPQTGNKCTGDVKVQDNLAPKLECGLQSVLLPCSFSTDPVFADYVNASGRFPASGLPLSLVDFQTRTFTIPANFPNDATVSDVDLRVRINNDVFFSNIRIEVESPSGVVVRVWDQVGGCGALPIWARFDDEGLNSTACANLTTDKNVRIPFNVGAMSTFDGLAAKGAWKVRIQDVDGGGDIASIQTVELYISANGTYSTGLPNGLTIPPVTKTGANTFVVPAGLLDACSDVTLSYTDQFTPLGCATGLTGSISRRWLARDAAGNTGTCLQNIDLLRPTFADVNLPPNYDGIDEPEITLCTGPYPTPDWIEGQGFQGYPYLYGQPGDCSISWDYEDQEVWICDGSYDIIRTWTITDPCADPEFLVHKQTIHIRDKAGPTFIDMPVNLTVTTDPFACCASVNLPDVPVSDLCSGLSSVSALVQVVNPYTQSIDNEYVLTGGFANFPGNNLSIPDTLAVLPGTPCLPVGSHIVTYIAQDDCGNIASQSFTITVYDFAPPQPACDEFTVVSIGIDDPNDCYYPSANGCEFAGVTWVRATTFDDGSYDNCNGIKFTIRRAPPYSSCITNLNGCEYATATAESDSIKFYCCEVGTSQMVILRVYQLNPDGSISTLPDGTPIYNECQVEVEVQDKLKPVCEAPLNVTVSCENFDPTLWAYGLPNVYDNCCLDATKEYFGKKGITHQANISLFDTVCNRGTITRTFRVFDCRGFSSQCTQRITVNYEQDYFVRFPDDKVVTVCDGTANFGEPQLFGEDCELLGISYTDQVFTVVPDACYKIERTWKIINWCTYQPNNGCVNVPNPDPAGTLNSPLNNPGPVVSAPGTVGAWAPTVVKVSPGDQTATNYSTFWSPNVNCYTYKQIIKVVDGVGPEVNCPASPIEYCDVTGNDPLLWNEIYWWDPQCLTHNLCEGPVDLSISATDLCSGPNISFRYLIFFDLDQDGVMETVVNSVNPNDPGTVRFGNANTQNYTGGTSRVFDHRNVSNNLKYRFGLQTEVIGNNVTASVRWNTLQSPNSFSVPELPYGTHKIKWFVSDGCGNERACEYLFTVRDCKPPNVTCLNGLTANVMPGGMQLFISDFVQGATDNCTPEDQLKFAIRRSGNGTGFPVDANGNPLTSVTFNCDDLGTQEIELWAKDKAGNADFCLTYIIIQDNLNNCGPATGSATIAGYLKTENAHGLEECDVEIAGQNPAGPSFNYFGLTDVDGAYKFSSAIPMFSNYTVTPTKDDNPLNGVSTFDLVLISKHILGVDTINSPYALIAADANMSRTITATDIIELRKLILGLYDDLPNNTSWRFVDKSFVFPNPSNPFETTFPETKSVAEVENDNMEEDFVAVKVGDVNSNAMANSQSGTSDRSNGVLVFDLDDKSVKAGDEFVVHFKAAEPVSGYQFTLNYDGLEIADLMPGPDMRLDNFALFAQSSAMTTSWHGNNTPEFSIRFRAKRSGELHDLLGISSRITKAEAYVGGQQKGDLPSVYEVALRFNTDNGSTLSGVGFELYQNQPNPWVNKTVVGFHLPDDADATLIVTDASGRQVYRIKGAFAKGYNYFVLDRAAINTTGVLYYTLETRAGSATKKMIQSKQ